MFALGRWVVVLTHIAECTILLLVALLAGYFAATGHAHLQRDKAWDSIVFHAIFVPYSAVLLSWGVFCLALAVLLRRRTEAGSLRQIGTLLRIAIPFVEVRYYERTICRLSK